MTDVEIVEAIRSSVTALRDAVEAAKDAGMSVHCDRSDLSNFIAGSISHDCIVHNEELLE